MKILTSYWAAPIPIRCCDWSAWIDGQEEWLTGRGPTEAAAIADLKQQIAEESDTCAWCDELIDPMQDSTYRQGAEVLHTRCANERDAYYRQMAEDFDDAEDAHADAAFPAGGARRIAPQSERGSAMPQTVVVEQWDGAGFVERRLEWDEGTRTYQPRKSA